MGYRGFGMVHADLVAAVEADGFAGVAGILDSNGIVHLELEMLNDWFVDGGPRRTASDEVRTDLLRAAERLHPHHIKVGGEIGGVDWPWGQLVQAFAELCRDAAEVGTRVAFEPMPFGQINTLDLARRLVDDAGDEHGGLILDLWHMARGCGDLPSIRALPARYIFAVELDDADSVVHGTLLEDTLDHRRLCGEGDQDVPGFIRAVTATGHRGPWGVEILSDDFRRLPLREQVTRSYQTTISQFPA